MSGLIWYICPVCRVRCNQSILCPSCDARLVKVDEYSERPIQLPMWSIPIPPTPSEWRIEWRHKPAKCGVWATNSLVWKSYAENFKTEGDAKKYLRRVRAKNKRLGDREYRIRVSLWKHRGDISLAWTFKGDDVSMTPVIFPDPYLDIIQSPVPIF